MVPSIDNTVRYLTNSGQQFGKIQTTFVVQADNGIYHCFLTARHWEIIEESPLGEPTILVQASPRLEIKHSCQVVAIPAFYHVCCLLKDSKQHFHASSNTEKPHCLLLNQGQMMHNQNNPYWKIDQFSIHSTSWPHAQEEHCVSVYKWKVFTSTLVSASNPAWKHQFELWLDIRLDIQQDIL